MKKPNKVSQSQRILALTVLVNTVSLLIGCSCAQEGPPPIPPPEMTAAEVFSICSKPSQHYDPRISENIVVWHDNRNGNYDIYGFDLSAKNDSPICTDVEEQQDAAISGNIIIWVDHRKGVYVYDIYGYDLSTETEFLITNIRQPTGPWRGPNIDGNLIVCEDDTKGYWEKYGYDICGYNLATKTGLPICVNPSHQACPKVSGNIVVWTDDRNGNGDIYGYDLSTQTEFAICTNEAYQGWADIRGNIVVWQDERNGNSDVYGYDLSTGIEFPICTEPHEQVGPLVSGNVVVWEDRRHSWWQEKLDFWFYGYNLSTETEFPVARYDAIFGMGLQDFDGDTIVYYDMEGEGSWKIMGLRLP